VTLNLSRRDIERLKLQKLFAVVACRLIRDRSCLRLALLLPSIRGLWLSHVATNEQVKDYVLVGAKLDMASMLIAVGKVASVNAYAAIYKHWPSLSGYTHTGEDQVQRWLRTEHIEPAYSKAELSELIQLSGGVAELVFQAVLAISSDR